MNALIHADQSFDFATADELLALPRVRTFTADPACTHLGLGDGQLVAFVGNPSVMHIVGRVSSHVALQKSISPLKDYQS